MAGWGGGWSGESCCGRGWDAGGGCRHSKTEYVLAVCVASARLLCCRGYGGYGEIGNGLNTNVNSPDWVVGGHTFSAITAGTYHACGIRISDSAAVCWGDYQGTSNYATYTPTVITGGYAFSQITGGYYTTLGLLTNVGRARHLPAIARVAKCFLLVAPHRLPAADWLASDCPNMRFSLGIGSAISTYVNTPVLVAGGYTWSSLVDSHISEHSCAVNSNSTLMCWGAK